MSNANKKIGIFPNTNQEENPKITFTGYDDQTITLEVLENNIISFKNKSGGEVFAITTSGIIAPLGQINEIRQSKIDGQFF